MIPQKHLKNLREISMRDDTIKGYAASPQKFIDPFLPRFKVIVYRKGPYLVIDRYSGDEQYIGQTITLYRKRPVDGLNYYGTLLDRRFKASIVWGFLKKALRTGAGKTPHRGLNGFKEGKWLYKNTYKEANGFVEGEEKIYYDKALLYRAVYHGGMIEDTRSYKEWSKGLKKMGNI